MCVTWAKFKLYKEDYIFSSSSGERHTEKFFKKYVVILPGNMREMTTGQDFEDQLRITSTGHRTQRQVDDGGMGQGFWSTNKGLLYD